MLVTLVIRLVPEGLAAGRFVGQVEHVGSGETQLVHGVSDLVGFAQRAGFETTASADLSGGSANGDTEV